MEGILLAIIFYFSIGIFFYISISLGKLDLDIQSKQTGEFLDKNTMEYEILKLIFSIGWIFMALQMIGRGGDSEGNNR